MARVRYNPWHPATEAVTKATHEQILLMNLQGKLDPVEDAPWYATPDEAVRELREITGANFGTDARAWERWFLEHDLDAIGWDRPPPMGRSEALTIASVGTVVVGLAIACVVTRSHAPAAFGAALLVAFVLVGLVGLFAGGWRDSNWTERASALACIAFFVATLNIVVAEGFDWGTSPRAVAYRGASRTAIVVGLLALSAITLGDLARARIQRGRRSPP